MIHYSIARIDQSIGTISYFFLCMNQLDPWFLMRLEQRHDMIYHTLKQQQQTKRHM